VIGGFTKPEGTRDFFGAILVGYYKRGKLLFASKVGTGFDQRLLKSLHQRFEQKAQRECPFKNLPQQRDAHGGGMTAAGMKSCRWLKPTLVCEVRFSEWTRDGHLRQPVFTGLREDKEAREVTREKAD
jgi:bifunctional non-homologous end joining protein LigD